MIRHYGETHAERRASENDTCRRIVRELGDMGVSERQRLYIIYLLAMELEDVTRMKSITAAVRDVAGQDLFVSEPNEH